MRGISFHHKAVRMPAVSRYFPSHGATVKQAYNDICGVCRGDKQDRERKVSRDGGSVMGGRHL